MCCNVSHIVGIWRGVTVYGSFSTGGDDEMMDKKKNMKKKKKKGKKKKKKWVDGVKQSFITIYFQKIF